MALFARLTGGLIGRVMVVAFALGAAQFPLYYLAYANTLAGARAEAEARMHQLELEAGQLQLDVETFIRRHETSADETFRASGRIHRTTLEHYQRYTAQDSALRAAEVWQKPWVLAKNFDPALHAVTRFEPGVPLTPEGGVYALAGLLLAWMLTGLASLAIRPRT